MSKFKGFAVLVTVLLIANVGVFAQTKCMFLHSSDGMTVGDVALQSKLEEWGYEVTATPSADLEFMFLEEITVFDFAFVSESIGSGDLAKGDFMKTLPIPVACLEGWVVKPGALDLQTDRVVANIDPPVPVKVVDNTGHPLAAGFAAGASVTLCTEGLIVASVPQINHIPIAVLSTDETQEVIYGVEAGTENAVGVTFLNRLAIVGIHDLGVPTMTDDAYTFMKAAIDWVLAGASPVEGRRHLVSDNMVLHQNYPNPFNPTTEIAFSIAKNMDINLDVYNAQGQLVKTIVNEQLSAGAYTYSFNAQDLSSGVYYCKLQSENDVQTQKMILMK